MKNVSSPTSVGRPRAFDPDAALEKAMQVFWRQGYEGTSLSDLTEAMGINRPSLYATFGNKEELFVKVLNRYASGPMACVIEALNEPTARAVVEKLLKKSAELMADPDTPRGCMVVQGVLCGGPEVSHVVKEARDRRLAMQKHIEERFEKSRRDGDLPASVSAQDLARHVVMLVNGMSIQAANGASPEELRQAAAYAFDMLPLP